MKRESSTFKIDKVPKPPADKPVVIVALYKFTSLPQFKELRPLLQTAARKLGLRGTLLLAHEGIHGNLAGSRDLIGSFIERLEQEPAIGVLDVKFTFAKEQPFYRMKVRLKKEIVTLGQPSVDPTNTVGTYVDPADWNRLIDDPDTLVIDTRNDYEVSIGTFENAVNPETSSFRDFADFVDEKLKPLVKDRKPKNIAMFCTGGIRCEKSTSYLLQEGFENVFHLKGGILKYLEIVPQDNSRWQGECFVFDGRVSVGQDLQPGTYDMCHACRMPLSSKEKQHPAYRSGISCCKCIDNLSESQVKRFSDRQKQVELAKQRGEIHIGSFQDMNES